MIHRIGADLVLLAHFLFAAFAVFGGFIQHYVGRAVYPRGMPRRMELIAGVSILAGNALVYACILAWAPR
jgi:hypothetical protein